MKLPELPIELYRNVVENFDERLWPTERRRCDLLSLCFTSRALGAEATRILYRNPNIGDLQDYTFSSGDRSERELVANAQRFHRTLVACPGLAKIVRGLKISLAQLFHDDPTPLQMILDALPHLQNLVFVERGAALRQCPDWIPLHIPNLVELRFDGAIMVSERVLSKFARHPHLRFLSANRIDFGGHAAGAWKRFSSLQVRCLNFNPSKPWLNLKHLAIGHECVAGYDFDVSVWPILQNLEGLRVAINPRWESLENVVSFIQKIGARASKLRVLWVELASLDSPDFIPESMVCSFFCAEGDAMLISPKEISPAPKSWDIQQTAHVDLDSRRVPTRI